MSRPCSVCQSPAVAKIDEALVAGRSQESISAEYGPGEAAIQRHRKAHLSPALVAVAARREERRSVKLVDRLDAVVAKVEALIESAEEDGNPTQMLAAAREFRSGIELIARLTGELDERPQLVTVNVLASAEVTDLLRMLMSALEPFPEARIAAAAALDEGGEAS
jgi:hypothetical protein